MIENFFFHVIYETFSKIYMTSKVRRNKLETICPQFIYKEETIIPKKNFGGFFNSFLYYIISYMMVLLFNNILSNKSNLMF